MPIGLGRVAKSQQMRKADAGAVSTPLLLHPTRPKCAADSLRHRADDSMHITKPFLDRAPWDIEDDKLREECGVFGVIGARDAGPMTAQGLHALQHRGQEAVGITSFDAAARDRGKIYTHPAL